MNKLHEKRKIIKILTMLALFYTLYKKSLEGIRIPSHDVTDWWENSHAMQVESNLHIHNLDILSNNPRARKRTHKIEG